MAQTKEEVVNLLREVAAKLERTPEMEKPNRADFIDSDGVLDTKSYYAACDEWYEYDRPVETAIREILTPLGWYTSSVACSIVGY